MPKNNIDYSKTAIYKIVSKDPEVTDCYVGHTTNLGKRRREHRSACNNDSHSKHNLFVYQFIREHGGFVNWEIILIKEVECTCSEEARKHENKWRKKLGATLNVQVPGRTRVEWHRDNKQKIATYCKKYQEDNKQKIATYQKKYREENKQEIDTYKKKYYNDNKEKITDKEKKYREDNKQKIADRRKKYYEEKLKEKRQENIECGCGSVVTKGSYTRHLKTKKHQEYLESK